MPESALTEILPEIVDLFLKGHNLPEAATPATLAVKSIFETVKLIKEDAFNSKLKILLTETSKATDQQRIYFLRSLGKDHNRFWKELIMQLDAIENEEKALVTANLAHAVILTYINSEQLSRLNLVIKNTHYKDLEYFYKNFKSIAEGEKNDSTFMPYDLDKDSKVVIDNLVNARLLREKGGSSVIQVGLHSRLGYDVTDLGKILIRYGF